MRLIRSKTILILIGALLSIGGVITANVLEEVPKSEIQNPVAKKLSLTFEKDRIVLLEFWASWCKSCEGSWPVLKALADEFPANKLKIVAVSLDSSAKNFETYIRAYKIPKGMVIWDNFGVAKRFSVDSVPTTMLLFDGEVVYRTSKSLSFEKPELRKRVISSLIKITSK